MARKKVSYRKKSAARRTSYKKAPARKSALSRAPRDGTTMILNGYFEAVTNLPAVTGAALDVAAKNQFQSYVIQCCPKGGVEQLAGTGATKVLLKGDGTQDALTHLSMPSFDTMANLYRQYQIRSVQVTIIVDTDCGIKAPVICSTDKGEKAALQTIAKAMTGAHRETVTTESKRSVTYGWKPNDAQSREWHTTGDELAQGDSHFIKVFQPIERKDNVAQSCKHQVSVKMVLALKDSKN